MVPWFMAMRLQALETRGTCEDGLDDLGHSSAFPSALGPRTSLNDSGSKARVFCLRNSWARSKRFIRSQSIVWAFPKTHVLNLGFLAPFFNWSALVDFLLSEPAAVANAPHSDRLAPALCPTTPLKPIGVLERLHL